MDKQFNFHWLSNKALPLVVSLALLSGCGNTGGNSASQNNSQSAATALTIDSAGVIPVFGTNPTATVIYVHNHSNTTIRGIDYVLTNTVNSNQLTGQLNTQAQLDGSQCSAIAAGQSCAVKITTPQLTEQSTQGSMSLRANYTLNTTSHSFQQLINYARVNSSASAGNGVKFMSGTNIYGHGNSSGYATLYLYASGVNQNYTISSITLDKPALALNMNYNQLTLSANSVQAIEVSSPILASSISANLTVQSKFANSSQAKKMQVVSSAGKNLTTAQALLDSQFSDSVSLAVEPVSAGAILTSGLVPLINTVNGTSATLLIQNSGNQAAEIGSISAGSGISNLSGCSNTPLAAAETCSLSFQVSQAGGSANLTIPYSGGSATSIVTNVTWFNGSGAPLVSMTSSNNPLSFPATIGGSSQITITNIGGYTLSNITIPQPRLLGGSATAILANNHCAESAELAVGASCSYDVEIADNATELNQQVNLGFNADYAGDSGTQNYSRVVPLTYSSTSYGALISLSTLSVMAVSGDNIESTIQELTISNNGAANADLTSLGLVDNPAFLVADTGDCGSSLPAGQSCTLALKLGPTTYSAVESSGVANYVVNYAAVGQTPAGVESTSVAWNLINSISAPIIEMVASVTGCASGDGITTTCMSNPTATGGSADSIQVVLTFTNSSTVTPANTISLPESSSALFTVPGYTLASNSCTSGAAINNGSCTIIYALPSSVATTAFQSNLSRADFAYDYTYGSDLSGSSISNLATMIDVVMPTLAIESITSMAVGESSTATINWGNLYQATAPTTTTTAIESDGTSIVAGLSSATPATCGSVSSNSASCTSLITSTQSTPIKGGYLFNATAAGGVSATPKSFNVFSNNVIFATSGKWNGRLGGYSGADTKCNADANKPSGSSPGAGKTYKALLEGNNATTTDVIYYRTDGITQIATATGGDLVGYGSLLNKITTSIVASWTGYNGTNCTNWTYALSDVRGYSGASSSTTYTWWASSSQICSLTRTLYCVAQ